MNINPIYISIGHKISQLRTKQGITQEVLASKSGIARSYLADIERGEKRVSIELLQQITSALETSLAQLFQSL